MDLTTGELLFYGGIILMSASAIGALVAAVLLTSSKRRLHLRLDQEFGKKRR